MKYAVIRWFSLVVVFACAAAATALGQGVSVRGDLERSFAKFDVVRLAGSSLAETAAAKGSLEFTGGRNFELKVTPHDMRSAGFQALNTGIDGLTKGERASVTTFRGTLTGERSSEVRLSIVGSRFEGMLKSGGETYFIEPAAKYSALAAADEYVIYRADDVLADQSFACGSRMSEKLAVGRSMVESSTVGNIAGVKQVRLATEADLEYVNTLGGAAQANQEILGILNTLEGLYASELNIDITVVMQHTWTTGDSYAGANTEQTVRNFQAYWNAVFPQDSYPRSAAHLFSGKANLLSQGWAFIGALCANSAYAYGMTGYISWAPGKYLVTAHELGHNLGANHVDLAPNCGNSLMISQLSGATPLSFCQASRDEVGTYVTTSGNCLTPGAACAYDFDGDAMADLSIFRPESGEWWFLKSSNGSNSAAQFGSTGDAIMPADFTGDGKTDMAFFRPATGFWYVLRSDDQSFYAFPFGSNGDVPAAADYDGDGRADAAVFRPSTLTWYISRSSGGTDIVGFGASGDKPVPGDYDGDGKADIAVFRANGDMGEWWIQRSSDRTVFAARFGGNTDKSVQADYTGDGKADIAVWRPSNGNWYVLRSEDASFYAFPFGGTGDVPVAGDYDGDGKADAAVYRPSNATWYANRSSGGTMIRQFGRTGDVPVPGAFVR